MAAVIEGVRARVTFEEAAVRDYEGLAYAIASDYFHASLDAADLRQEALVGVVKACRSFDPSGGLSFRPFVALCVRRHVIRAVKTAGRMKHEQLTSALRVVDAVEGDPIEALEHLPSLLPEPPEQVVARDELARALRVFDSLSALERRAIVARANGLYSTTEVDGKRFDNAIQRAMCKFREAA